VIAQNPLGQTKADAGSTVSLTVSQGLGNTNIPSVTGLPQRAAVRELRTQGLKLKRVEHEHSDNVPKGQATRTDPPAGTSVPVGSGVALFISSGQAKVAVPDVTNQPQSVATATLKAAGFTVTTSNQTSTTVTDGNVISQNPAGSTTAAPGSNVNLIIAKAPTTAQVPDVTGDTSRAAVNALAGAGFTVAKKTKNVKQQNLDGIVVSENPPPGSTQTKGSTVTIVIGHFTQTTTTTTSTTSSPSSSTSTTTSSTP
jgi:serine/threonine-protein kinase